MKATEEFRIAGLGELLWDLFPGNKRPGGAPANVAYHARQLGNNGIVLSRTGNDEAGKRLVKYLETRGIETSYIQIDQQKNTGTVDVQFKEEEPFYTITENVAWDYLELNNKWKALTKSLDAICFGTLAQRNEASRNTIYEFLQLLPGKTLRVLDVNLRQPYYNRQILYHSILLCNVIKLNQDEHKLIKNIFEVDAIDRWLISEMGVDLICLTKGSEGSELITSEEHLSVQPEEVDPSKGDAVGVGDAFTASLIHHLLRKQPLNIVLEKANQYAGLIVTKKGGMPELTDTLISHYR